VAFEDDHPNRTVKIRLDVPGEIQWHVAALLEYKDMFTVGPTEMLSVDPAIIEHH